MRGGIGGVLTGHELERCIAEGELSIAPYDPEQMNEASYDLTLGPIVRCYHTVQSDPASVLDPKRPETLATSYDVIPDSGLVLQPGRGYLLHTNERICARSLVGVIDGKSTLGRLFMLVHYTAGYVDPGFDGQYTLECSVVHPLRIYPGMRIAQVRFHTTVGIVRSYQERGQYVGDKATGAVAAGASRLIKG